MTITLDRPAPAPTTPAGTITTSDDALLEWVSGLRIGEAAVALAVSDMPKDREAIDAALGFPTPRFVNGRFEPIPEAALVLARWVAQGVARLGGEFETWGLSERLRAARLRRVSTDTAEAKRAYRAICKPLGGVRHTSLANDFAHSLKTVYLARHPRLVNLYVPLFWEDTALSWSIERVTVRELNFIERDLGAVAVPFRDGFRLAERENARQVVLVTEGIG